jgi:hypothetical protein
MIGRLAWVTTAAARGLDDDEPLAVAALTRAGVAVDVVDWDDADVRWSAYDRTVLRSTWDYPERLPQFRRWLRSVQDVTDLRNSLDVVEWNLDKHYLADLDRAGVPAIPTTFLEPGDELEPPDGDYVLKPAVGAGSRDAASYGPGQADLARAHVRRLHERGTSVLVQPLLASVAVDGEWPLIFLDGRYSHAASKRVSLPRAGVVGELFAAETNTWHSADDEQLAVAGAAVEVVTRRFGAPTYARVDLVRDDAGRVRVLELELVEPSLFLPQAGNDAVDRLVAALTAA